VCFLRKVMSSHFKWYPSSAETIVPWYVPEEIVLTISVGMLGTVFLPKRMLQQN
jgi:hypothetical protein